MKTVLMITRSFPPLFATGGKRAYRFARYLPRHGWRPVVVTSPIPASRPTDPTAGLDLDPAAVVLRELTPRWWPSNRGGAGSDGTVASPTRTTKGPPRGLARRLTWHVGVPVGDEVALVPYWARLAARLAREHRLDAIYATSGPYTALVCGAVASHVTGLPLLADLRDPWSLNFGQAYKPPWIRAVEARVEAHVLSRAARVIFTNEPVVEAYRAHYGSLPPDRFACIYNSFDPEQAPAPRAPADDAGPVRLVHFGNCYWGRSLDTIVRAAAEVRRRRALTADHLRVLNLGRMAQEDLDLMAALGVGDLFEHRTFVPYAEGLEILAGADALLLLACGDETLFVAGKLFDYFLVGRPIVGVSQPCDQTRLVEETRSGVVIAPGDVPAAVAVLERLLATRDGGPPIAAVDREAVAQYSAPHAAGRLAQHLDEISGAHAHERGINARAGGS
jgi:hypothetical protein